jgi:hypothetical protein
MLFMLFQTSDVTFLSIHRRRLPREKLRKKKSKWISVHRNQFVKEEVRQPNKTQIKSNKINTTEINKEESHYKSYPLFAIANWS